MPNHLHLTLQDRSIICARLTEGVSFRQIGLDINANIKVSHLSGKRS